MKLNVYAECASECVCFDSPRERECIWSTFSACPFHHTLCPLSPTPVPSSFLLGSPVRGTDTRWVGSMEKGQSIHSFSFSPAVLGVGSGRVPLSTAAAPVEWLSPWKTFRFHKHFLSCPLGLRSYLLPTFSSPGNFSISDWFPQPCPHLCLCSCWRPILRAFCSLLGTMP